MTIKLNVAPEEAAKLQAALADEAFADSLIAMQSPEEVQAALKTKDVNLTIDEINELAKAINAANSGDELSEENLEDVAGGAFINIYWDYKKGRLNVTIGW